MAGIWKRPVDLLFVLIFATFAVIAVTIGKYTTLITIIYANGDFRTDFVQSTYGAVLEQEQLEYGVWPPRVVVDVYFWWCQNYDTLLGHNPVW